MSIQRLDEPFGVTLTAGGALPKIETLMALATKHKCVLLKDYNALSKDVLVQHCQQSADLLEWDFGPVMEMKVSDKPKNYLFTKNRVPFHWDGAFSTAPRFLFFHCIKAPDKGAGGETFLIDGEALYEASSEAERSRFKQITLRYATEKLAHYGGDITIDLLQHHPETGRPLLRLAEPVGKGYLNPVLMKVIPEEATALVECLIERCYSKALMRTHIWEDGDYLIVDNLALLHGRNAFVNSSPRHLRRLQIL